MALDIVILIIFAFSVVRAARVGFTGTVINFTEKGVSLVLAVIFKGKLATILWEHTFLGTWAHYKISSSISQKITDSSIYKVLPDMLKPTEENLTSQIISEESEKIAFMLISILAFFIIYFILKLIFSLIVKFIKHQRKKRTVISVFDRILGGVIGIIIGIFSVFVFLGLLPTLVGIFMPDKSEYVAQLFSTSLVAQDLYDNNLVLLFFKNMI